MKNINTAFRHTRTFNLLFLTGCVCISCFVIHRTNKTLAENRGKVYVMVNGQLVRALAMDRDIPVEVRDHIRRFHQLFFTLSPDEKAIQTQINKALYLADGSARRQYQNLKESGYYSDLISGNISQTIEVEQIDLDMNTVPYQFTCRATQQITRPTSLLTRSLVTRGYVRTGMVQSDNNSHGFLIERWEVLENKDLKITNR